MDTGRRDRWTIRKLHLVAPAGDTWTIPRTVLAPPINMEQPCIEADGVSSETHEGSGAYDTRFVPVAVRESLVAWCGENFAFAGLVFGFRHVPER